MSLALLCSRSHTVASPHPRPGKSSCLTPSPPSAASLAPSPSGKPAVMLSGASLRLVSFANPSGCNGLLLLPPPSLYPRTAASHWSSQQRGAGPRGPDLELTDASNWWIWTSEASTSDTSATNGMFHLCFAHNCWFFWHFRDSWTWLNWKEFYL